MTEWLLARATKLAHPDKQVRVVLAREAGRKVIGVEVLLSVAEAEAAVRQLMQAHADAIGKSLTMCAYPKAP